MAASPRWVWRKAEPTSLARFVTADCAASAVPPITLGDGRSIHDAVRGDDRRAVLAAAYAAVAGLGIDYDIETYTADGQHSQVVRTPLQIRDRRRATCLDLALLFAGLALDATLRPLVVVLEGHALIAVVDSEFSLEVDPATQADTLLGWIDQGVLIPLECTGAARGEGLGVPFDEAVTRGRAAIEQRRLLFAIDPFRLQRDQGIEPASCAARPRRWVLPAGTAGAAVVAGLAWWLWPEPLPVFASGVEGVAVPAVAGAPEVGEWLADGLARAAEGGSGFIDVDACGLVSRLEVWGPETVARVDLTAPDNPANVDVVLRGSLDPDSGDDPGATPFVTLDITPNSALLASAAEPALLNLGSSPAPVDLESDALVVFPELRVLPAVVAGLRQLELGSDEGLAGADCLFALADERLATQASARVQRYRASVAVLAANGHLLQASSAPEDRERELLERASALLGQARTHVDDAADAAVIQVNAHAVTVLGAITDEGALAEDVDDASVDELVASLDAAAADADSESAPAYVALRSLAGRVLLASFRRDGDDARLAEALAVTETALGPAAGLTGAGRRQAAELHEIRGIAQLAAGEHTDAISEFEAAAAAGSGVLGYQYRLQAATARIARCTGDDAAVIVDVVADTRRYLDSHDSQALAAQADRVADLSATRCPA